FHKPSSHLHLVPCRSKNRLGFPANWQFQRLSGSIVSPDTLNWAQTVDD
ncbi:MAG: hypothetical protein ACI89J_004696, partial [Hyphomicrobiaceae bacterium]